MCGIIGFVGKRDATALLIEGLRKLEYRGYDSCGIALSDGKRIMINKAGGGLENLIAKLSDEKGNIGIGHTRWATHGKPNEINSHPHFSDSGQFCVVHNGIIENYQEIKKFLGDRCFNFISQTDSEVIAHLIEYYYSGDIFTAIIKSCNRIKGSYALGIISLYEPQTLYAVKKESPLVIGIGKGENYIASDMPALLDYTRQYIMLDDGEIARISKDNIKVFNKNGELVEKKEFYATFDSFTSDKNGFPHFMLKEIYEQPVAIMKTLESSFDNKSLSEILPPGFLEQIDKIQIIACGSAFNAGYAAKYFLESLCNINVECDVASEFRYRNPVINQNTLAIVISQSGETADTLMGLRLAKEKHAFTLAVVNVAGSTIAREADYALYTKAGTEIAVATTKGYTTQLALLFRLALMLNEERKTSAKTAFLSNNYESKDNTNNKELFQNYLNPEKTSHSDFEKDISELLEVSNGLKSFLEDISICKQIAYNYFSHSNCFFLGRNIDYALAMEGALKYKEISYIHAECYPAGELKHGTISLIEEGSIVITCATEERLLEKTFSNIREVCSRGATCIVITPFRGIFENEAKHIIFIPKGKFLAPIAAVTAFQLISYFVADSRGCDIDKPRNLAKSVTVE